VNAPFSALLLSDQKNVSAWVTKKITCPVGVISTLILFIFQYSYDPKSADWSKEMRGNPLHSTVNLENWILVYTQRDTGNAKDFSQTLRKVCGPMGISVANHIE